MKGKDLYNAASVECAEKTRIALYLPGLSGNPSEGLRGGASASDPKTRKLLQNVQRFSTPEEAVTAGQPGAQSSHPPPPPARGGSSSNGPRSMQRRGAQRAAAASQAAQDPVGTAAQPAEQQQPASTSSHVMSYKGAAGSANAREARQGPFYSKRPPSMRSRFNTEEGLERALRNEQFLRSKNPLGPPASTVLERETPEQPVVALRAVPSKTLELDCDLSRMGPGGKAPMAPSRQPLHTTGPPVGPSTPSGSTQPPASNWGYPAENGCTHPQRPPYSAVSLPPPPRSTPPMTGVSPAAFGSSGALPPRPGFLPPEIAMLIHRESRKASAVQQTDGLAALSGVNPWRAGTSHMWARPQIAASRRV